MSKKLRPRLPGLARLVLGCFVGGYALGRFRLADCLGDLLWLWVGLVAAVIAGLGFATLAKSVDMRGANDG